MEKLLKQAHIESCLLSTPGVPTISKLRVVGRNQQLIRLDLEEGFKNNFDDNLTALETDLDAFSADPIID